MQSSLPVAEGGLGLRQAAELSVPAFMSSCSSVSSLVNGILPAYVAGLEDPSYSEGSSLWVSATGSQIPPPERKGSQREWEKGMQSVAKTTLQDRATNLHDKARLLGVASAESGAFLNAVPSPSLGTFMTDNVFRIALSLRLGSNICQAHVCPCGESVDSSGTHGLRCKRSSGRLSRHATVNDIIKRGLVAAGFPVSLEPPYLSTDSNKRPDGITMTPWQDGKSLIWDFTCVDSTAPSYLATSAGVPLFAASSAESKKKDKYAAFQQSFNFAPIAAECLGSFGKDSLLLLKRIGRKISEATGEKRASEYFFQRLSFAIQRGNAASVMGSIPRDSSLDEFISML